MNPLRRRALVRAAALAISLAAVAVGLHAGNVKSQGTAAVAQPALDVPLDTVTMAGSASQSGETFAYGQLGAAPALGSDGKPIRTGAGGFAFARHTAAEGWRVFQGAPPEPGAPSNAPLNNFRAVTGPGAGRVTPGGGVVVVGCADRGTPPRPRSPTILIRDPRGRFRVAPDPPLLPGETLVNDSCTETAFAAIEQGGRTGLVIAPQTSAQRQDTILRFDGTSWTRELIENQSFQSFSVEGMGAASLGNAWLSAGTAERGIVLFKRSGDRWTVQELPDGNPFKSRSNGGLGIVESEPLGYPAESLTVGGAGVWADGRVRLNSGVLSFTVLRAPDGTARTFCDASFCNAPLGAALSSSNGYRSFAFGTSGQGTRIITNPLRELNAEDSNRGTYLAFDGSAFRRLPGAGGDGSEPSGGAFSAVDRGFLSGNTGLAVEITRSPAASRLQAFPVPFRRPLGAVAPEPGKPVDDGASRAVTVGQDGIAARFYPERGWDPEPMLEDNGTRARPDLRGVAWPERRRAHAVGDRGEMWLWQEETGLWERDEAAPEELEANLMSVAFDPADSERGFTVGRGGTLLRYDKTWTQEGLPAGFAKAEFTSVAFAGRQAITAAFQLPSGGPGGLLVNDGGGWRADGQANALLRSFGGKVTAVAGLPDGGAVAAGPGTVIVRDRAGGPWRLTQQPLSRLLNPVAAAAVRSGSRVRAVVSVDRRDYPQDPQPERVEDPSQPTPPLEPFPLPAEGYVLSETGNGWRDQQRQAFRRSGPDLPVNPDPILGFALNPQGRGFAVGGETGQRFAFPSPRLQTAGIYRFPPAGAPPNGVGSAPAPQRRGPVRLVMAGHAQCERACADLAPQAIGPDRGLSRALARAGELRGSAGPRAFLYTGARVSVEREGLNTSEAQRYAQIARSAPLPFFPAPSEGNTRDQGSGFRSAFAPFSSPLGAGTAPDGIGPVDSGATPGPGARTHYAFDTFGAEGALRVVVIDNSYGSLAESDRRVNGVARQNPNERQEPWLRGVLGDARAQEIPAVVVGSRDLNSAVRPRSNAATDADRIANLLVQEGASAYFFDRPEENREYRIPAGGSQTIPTYGTGTLGYTNEEDTPQLFGESGMLLTEIDTARRNPATNRAPVNVRLLPVIEDLAINSLDGTVLRRSRPALFEALARRPRAGIRDPGLSGRAPDPYVPIPPQICQGSQCGTRIDPEYRFESSRPDIGDFVRRDPASTNLRAVALSADGRPVTDNRSGLFCPFNSGTTRVTIKTGNLSFTQNVTVQGGQVRRPCGTRRRTDLPGPINVEIPPLPAPESPNPGPQPDVQLPPPPSLAAAPPLVFLPLVPEPAAPAATTPRPSPPSPPVPPGVAGAFFLPVIVPPPAPPSGRPTPPSGVGARVYQVEREEEEEAALEESQAASAYSSDDPPLLVPLGLALLIVAAAAGSTIARPRRRVRPAPVDLGPSRQERRYR